MMSGPRRHQLKNRLVIVILHVVLRVAQQDDGKRIRIAQMLLVGIDLCPELEECRYGDNGRALGEDFDYCR